MANVMERPKLPTVKQDIRAIVAQCPPGQPAQKLIQAISKMGNHSLLSRLAMKSSDPVAKAFLYAAADLARRREEAPDLAEAHESRSSGGRTEWDDFRDGQVENVR
jgi:hypothetical protein